MYIGCVVGSIYVSLSAYHSLGFFLYRKRREQHNNKSSSDYSSNQYSKQKKQITTLSSIQKFESYTQCLLITYWMLLSEELITLGSSLLDWLPRCRWSYLMKPYKNRHLPSINWSADEDKKERNKMVSLSGYWLDTLVVFWHLPVFS